MSLQEIEIAITRLPADEVKTLADWFTEYQEELWDKQIEKDAKAGRLDALINQAKEHIRQGTTSPL